MMKKVLIINPLGFYDAAPCVVSVISYMNELGYEIEMISIEKTQIKNTDFSYFTLFEGKKNSAVLILGKLIFPVFLMYKTFKKKYDIVISIDNWGLIYSCLFRKRNIKFIHIVLHIFSLNEARKNKNLVAYVIKKIENICVSGTDVILIQDKQRQASFIEENRNSENKPFIILPNIYRSKAQLKRTTFYPELLNLNIDTNIVILAGSIEKWAYPEFLIEATKQQKKGTYSTVIQSRIRVTRKDPYIRELTENSNEDVFFCLEPIDINSLDVAISSAHIGFAFYHSESHHNHSVLGFASGKMLTYLKNGIPVIMLDSTGITELIEEYQCGFTLKTMDVAEFNKAVETILENYRSYSLNALRCYEENFDFDSSMEIVCQFIESTK